MSLNDFASVMTQKEWRQAGEPYCEHEHFRKDIGPTGMRDPHDWYCTTCGVLWVNKTGDKPRPEGTR